MAVIVPAAIAVAAGIYKTGKGIHDTNMANKLSRAARPTYNIPQGSYDNVGLAGYLAGQGLQDSSKQLALNNADKGLSSSLATILKGGGDVNDADQTYRTYMDGISNIALADDAAKMSNIKGFINARQNLGNEQDKQWMVNKYGPWADNQQKAAQLRGQGAGEQSAGVNAIASGVTSGVEAYNGEQAAKAAKLTVDNSGVGTSTPSAPNTDSPIYIGDSMRANVSPDTPPGQVAASINAPQQYYGVDISKMAPSDAAMLNKLLYGSSGGY